MSEMILSDPALQTQLCNVKDSRDPVKRRHDYEYLYTSIQSYYYQLKYNAVSYISMYNTEFATHSYERAAKTVPESVREHLVSAGTDAGGAIVWNTDYCEDYGIFLVRSIRRISPLYLDSIGTLVLCLDVDQLIQNSSIKENYTRTSYFLYDQNNLIYHSNKFDYSDFNYLKSALDSTYKILSLHGKKYFAFHGFVPALDWEYISLIPYASIYRTVMSSFLIYIIIIIITIILAVLLSVFLIHSVFKHIDTLIRKMKAFRGQANEIPDVKYDYSNRNDELGILHRQFDSMVLEIKNLINEKYIGQILVRDAQLKALETQINPHFLYNTLESINWRAKAAGEKEISTMVESLGNLLHITLSKKDSTYSLEKELDLVYYYISIQQCRYEDRLCFHVSCDNSIKNARIPKLTIQPLVENAIQYGLEVNRDTCCIQIFVQNINNILNVKVMNSGSSFEHDLLQKLVDGSASPHGFGIGLQNIDQRLKLVFGNEYGINLSNESNCATVKLVFPYCPI